MGTYAGKEGDSVNSRKRGGVMLGVVVATCDIWACIHGPGDIELVCSDVEEGQGILMEAWMNGTNVTFFVDLRFGVWQEGSLEASEVVGGVVTKQPSDGDYDIKIRLDSPATTMGSFLINGVIADSDREPTKTCEASRRFTFTIDGSKVSVE